MNKQTYVNMLPQVIQDDIMADVYDSLKKEGMSDQLININMDGALNSRLGDLSDTINIEKYLK